MVPGFTAALRAQKAPKPEQKQLQTPAATPKAAPRDKGNREVGGSGGDNGGWGTTEEENPIYGPWAADGNTLGYLDGEDEEIGEDVAPIVTPPATKKQLTRIPN